MQWSVYFQNPEFLEQTRMFLIQPELKPLIRAWCHVGKGTRILDVGCGTGYFTRLLVEDGHSVTAVGLDIEEPFIDYARRAAAERSLPIEFLTGDALALPFEDESFDLVASHTFFTSISDPVKAMSEMKRVLRPGGTVASVTAMSFMPSVLDPGEYPPDCIWAEELRKRENQILQAYYRLDPLFQRTEGLKPAAVPRFFSRQGLEDVSAYPIGKMFCLSNAAVPTEEKLEWIRLYRLSEEKRMEAFLKLPEMRALLSEEDAGRYLELVREKCGWLSAHTNENTVWEWNGNANLLITGRKPSSERRQYHV